MPRSRTGRASIQRGQTGGFTLVEMLVGAVILAIMTAAVYTVLSSTATISARATAKLNASVVARECLDLIGRDLKGAQLPWDRGSLSKNASSPLDTPNLQFLVNPKNLPHEPDSLAWLAPISSPKKGNNFNKYGNIAEVGYFVLTGNDPNSHGKARFQLCQAFFDPEASGGGNYLVYQNPQWVTSDWKGQFTPDNSNGQAGWVADGVMGMWVQVLDQEGNLIRNGFDSRDPAKNGKSATYPNTTDGVPAGPYNGLPAYVEVALVCIAPQDIVKLKPDDVTAPSSSGSGSASDQAEKYAKEISGDRRVLSRGVHSIEAFSSTFRLYNAN